MTGRRVRYIKPVRLYQTISVLSSALIKYGASDVELFKTDEPPAQAKTGRVVQQRAPGISPHVGKEAGTAIKMDSDSANRIMDTEDEEIISKIAPQWMPKLTRFWHQSDAEKTLIIFAAFFAYVPFAVFCLLPLFALFLKVLYLVDVLPAHGQAAGQWCSWIMVW
jgi:hypothetical protein